eukprot:3564404-Amphidinium_carterae.1
MIAGKNWKGAYLVAHSCSANCQFRAAERGLILMTFKCSEYEKMTVSTKNVGPVMLNIYCKRFDKAPGPALTSTAHTGERRGVKCTNRKQKSAPNF